MNLQPPGMVCWFYWVTLTPMARQFLDLLYIFNLTQLVDKPTRTTRQSETLIDHIISTCPQRVKFTNVLPCSTISDHDAPYACIDIRVTRFAPRFKYIRNERQFNEESYVEDCANLPLSVVYALEDPNENLTFLVALYCSV